MGLSNDQGDKRGGQYPRSSNSPCIDSHSVGPRGETFQLTQLRFDSKFIFGNHRLVDPRESVVASVFDFRHVPNNLL
jgi:hypothetical protein